MSRKKIGLSFLASFILLCLMYLEYSYFNYAKDKKALQWATSDAISFDDSMQVTNYPRAVCQQGSEHILSFLRTLYEKHNPLKMALQPESRIPKIIHIMWLGGKLPQEFQPYVTSWHDHHPGWTIVFWTDNAANYDQGTVVAKSFDEFEQLRVSKGRKIVVDVTNIQFENRKFYDKAPNYGEKSDILKWEIVYRFGGVYVDTDFECLQPLDIFHHTYDFYTGIQPLDTNMIQLGAALYGAIPKHPTLARCVEFIKHNQHIMPIVAKTGPIHFTRSFLATAGRHGLRDIALPASYFYPCGYEERGTAKDKWCKQESYAVHHWAGSWLKPEALVRS